MTGFVAILRRSSSEKVRWRIAFCSSRTHCSMSSWTSWTIKSDRDVQRDRAPAFTFMLLSCHCHVTRFTRSAFCSSRTQCVREMKHQHSLSRHFHVTRFTRSAFCYSRTQWVRTHIRANWSGKAPASTGIPFQSIWTEAQRSRPSLFKPNLLFTKSTSSWTTNFDCVIFIEIRYLVS